MRQFCMERGTIVGILTSISFLCSMYGINNIILAQISNIGGLVAFFVAGYGIKKFRSQHMGITFGRACWMAVMIYFYAILLTAVVQYFYFSVLDRGILQQQIQQIASMPEYKKLLQQMAGEADIEQMIQNVSTLFAYPAKATMQLMWMNCFVVFFLTIPTALIGITGNTKKNNS